MAHGFDTIVPVACRIANTKKSAAIDHGAGYVTLPGDEKAK